jgi:hypothetical protein
MLRTGGYGGRAIGPLQMLSALCGALAVGFAFLAYRAVSASRAAAALAAALLATSWTHWVFSTDVHYIPLATMLAGAALAGAVASAGALSRSAATGVLAGLATLAWQANVFLLPALAIGMYRGAAANARLRSTGLFLAVASSVVLAGYLAAGAAAGVTDSVGELVRWGTSYKGAGHMAITRWGVLSPERTVTAARSWVSSVVPIWDGLGLRALLRGDILPDKLLPQLSLVALSLLLIASLARLIARLRDADGLFAVGWMLAAFALYLPFIVWWDPFEPKWFMVPNMFLAGALAALWRCMRRREAILLWACVAVVAAANFSNTVWPDHTRPNPNLTLAQCVARQLRPADLFVVSDWGWFGYAEYFERQPAPSLSVIDRRGRDTKVADITRRIADTKRRGGRVFMIDVGGYSAERREWLREQTELTVADFARFAPQPAFSCGDTAIVALGGS